jgi:hypothetical protein
MIPFTSTNSHEPTIFSLRNSSIEPTKRIPASTRHDQCFSSRGIHNGARIEDFDLSLFDHQHGCARADLFLTESTRARVHIVSESRVLSSELRR